MLVVAAKHNTGGVVFVVCARSHTGKQSRDTLMALQRQRNWAKAEMAGTAKAGSLLRRIINQRRLALRVGCWSAHGDEMKRRTATSLLAASTVPLVFAKRSQGATGRLRVGTVGLPRSSPHWQIFIRQMAERGYIEGDNFVFEFVEGTGGLHDFKSAYQELAARKVDIFLVVGTERALKAAREVSQTIPIVIGAIDYDPLAHGHVTDLARPGGQITGVYFQQIELTAKRLQILKDTFPGMKSATVFWGTPSADQWKAAQAVAPSLGIDLVGIQFEHGPYDYDAAFARVAPEHRQHLLVVSMGVFFSDRARLAQFALAACTRSMFAGREWTASGGLLSYGPYLDSMFQRLAEYVDRIARGMKPSELPIEQPAAFELVINLKTARALELAIPASILARANEVIE
jgi:putative ABC transport system substrate-binding protein